MSHHKGAMIVMTQVALRYGRSQRVASENSRDPAEEITAMLLAIEKELPWSAASPSGPAGSPGAGSMNTRTAPLVKTSAH